MLGVNSFVGALVHPSARFLLLAMLARDANRRLAYAVRLGPMHYSNF